MSHEEEKILLFDTLSIAIKRSEKEMKFWEIFLRPFSLFVVAYCCCCSIVGHSLFYFPSKVYFAFFFLYGISRTLSAFFCFSFYTTHSTDTTITLTVQQQHECVEHLFWLLSKLAVGFFVRFSCGTRRLRPAQNARTQSRVKMRTNGNMHNVKQTSNTHTIHAERRISCDVVGVSKKLGICSAALLALIPVISSSTNGEKICRVGDR
jgi:hypothetical protein